MGDNRDATRAPGAAPAAEKKGPAPDAGGGGAVPEGAAADPGSALTVLAASYGAQLIGVLQGAGGNAEVDAELASLTEGQQLAAKAKADKDAVAGMNDGEKVEKYGSKQKGEGGGGGEAPAPGAENAPPPGVPEQGAAAGFHASRAGELSSLAGQHGTVASSLGAAAATPGLAPELAAFLGEGASQSMAQQAALSGLASTYAAVGASLAGSEFIGAAMPSAGTAALYANRVAAIQGVVSTLDAMCGEYDTALGTEQEKIAECDTVIAELMQRISEASAKKGPEEGGGAPGAEANSDSKGPGSAPPGQEAKAPEKKSAPGAQAKSASASSGSTGNTGLPPAPAPAPAPQVDAAQAKSGGGGAAMGGAQADPVAGITAQVEQQKTKKSGIESQISANQSLISAIKAYRDQMNSLLAAYSSGSTPPGAAG